MSGKIDSIVSTDSMENRQHGKTERKGKIKHVAQCR